MYYTFLLCFSFVFFITTQQVALYKNKNVITKVTFSRSVFTDGLAFTL